jgi:protein-tyrosine phosphatase
VFSWFKKKENLRITPLTTDLHSHLLAGLDDGVKSLEEAEEIILQFQRLGYSKLITTPHVSQDQFRNTTEGILNKLDVLTAYLREKHIPMTVEAAAEYYLDEHLVSMVQTNQRLLTFGANYLLFETNFLNEPYFLKEFIFSAATKGYKPVLAHPERYLYLQNNLEKIEDLIGRGVLLQMNLNSIIGYYSKPVQLAAQKLIDNGWVNFLGSDCHHLQHVQLIEEIRNSKYFRKALSLPLLNNTL